MPLLVLMSVTECDIPTKVGFAQVHCQTAEQLTNTIGQCISGLGLLLKNLCGQGYDGATNIAGLYCI